MMTSVAAVDVQVAVVRETKRVAGDDGIEAAVQDVTQRIMLCDRVAICLRGILALLDHLGKKVGDVERVGKVDIVNAEVEVEMVVSVNALIVRRGRVAVVVVEEILARRVGMKADHLLWLWVCQGKDHHSNSRT
jgi:hypothetical protein